MRVHFYTRGCFAKARSAKKRRRATFIARQCFDFFAPFFPTL
jgi:hypothetical protein